MMSITAETSPNRIAKRNHWFNSCDHLALPSQRMHYLSKHMDCAESSEEPVGSGGG